MKKIGLIVASMLLFSACSKTPAPAAASTSQPEPEAVGGSTKREPVSSNELQFVWPADNSVFATLETSRGDIRLVLYPKQAPLAVDNFCTLAQMGYYDDTEFHRVVEGFVIQGGDATGTGKGGHSIWGTVFDTERSDELHHYAGALCAPVAGNSPDTHTSQFYIVAAKPGSVTDAGTAALDNAGVRADVVDTYRQAGGLPYLDNTDTVFGQVISGMDVVDKIASQSTDEETGRPKSAIKVKKVTIDNYPGPGEVVRSPN